MTRTTNLRLRIQYFTISSTEVGIHIFVDGWFVHGLGVVGVGHTPAMATSTKRLQELRGCQQDCWEVGEELQHREQEQRHREQEQRLQEHREQLRSRVEEVRSNFHNGPLPHVFHKSSCS
uniref:Uncharacterized protein n=1 Tax=Cacopsylla melanoneura TaxID=428564 RepID=A0A8D8ZMP5_9HEMI